jgi:hypothetical protein
MMPAVRLVASFMPLFIWPVMMSSSSSVSKGRTG